MAVPNTTNFTLQDVVNEIVPSLNTLRTCFNEAIDALFDWAYRGNKDRLSNFRNYNATGELTLNATCPGWDKDTYYDDQWNWITDMASKPCYPDIVTEETNSWSAYPEGGQSWLSASGSGTGNGSFNLGVTVNEGTSNRNAYAYVANDDHPSVRVSVIQHYYMLAVSPDYWDADPAGDTQGINVGTQTPAVPYTATVTTGGGWLSITSGGTGAGSGTVNLQVPANHTDYPRSGKITVEIDDPPGLFYDKYVDIDQAVDPWLTASPDPWEAAPEGDTETIVVDTYMDNGWTATVTFGGAWLSIFKGGFGTGDGSFGIMATENDSGQYRFGEITITSSAADFIVNVEQNPA